MTAKILKKQISDCTVETILKIIGFKNKKSFCDLKRDNKERLRLTVAKKVIEWQKQGVPPDQYEELKKSDLIKKFNLKTLLSISTNSNAGVLPCDAEPHFQVAFNH